MADFQAASWVECLAAELEGCREALSAESQVGCPAVASADFPAACQVVCRAECAVAFRVGSSADCVADCLAGRAADLGSESAAADLGTVDRWADSAAPSEDSRAASDCLVAIPVADWTAASTAGSAVPAQT